jgi:ABC-type bacteriocin/lantibiotic exporter with double-glycine peptidase domain
MAQLHDFVTNELPRGYDTPVGERGIRLSGGQRQRLGLARALYGNPAVLVLDEATSALDNETEAAVIQALDELRAGCTVIMIAHRLTTVRCCDFLVRMEDGRVTASGTPDKVLEGKEPTYARI